MDLVVLVVTVNGALGYGFPSITIPVALLFYTNRILNPALVLVELVINGYVLFINRKSILNIWWRVAPILIGLLIGVAIGSYILSLVHPSWVKFVTYFMLLPLILLQAAGIRKPIRAEKAIAIPLQSGNRNPILVLLGIPLESYLIRWMDPETFRRICKAFDALVVAFGLSRVLIELNLATSFTTYSILTI